MANPVVVLDDTLYDIADAIRSKNGSSDTYKPSEMPSAITAIPSGGGGVGIPREVSATGVYGFPAQSFVFSLPSGATDVSSYALARALYGCASLTSVDLSSLTTVSGEYAFNYAFYGCTSLTSVDLSSLTAVSGTGAYAFSSAFQNCANLTSVDFSSLTTVSAGNAFRYAFQESTSLTSVSFPALSVLGETSVFFRAFYKCTSLTSLSFPALTTSSFGSYTNQFSNMLYGVTGCTVHFPAAIRNTIGSWADVTGGFGGTNTTVLFDL